MDVPFREPIIIAMDVFPGLFDMNASSTSDDVCLETSNVQCFESEELPLAEDYDRGLKEHRRFYSLSCCIKRYDQMCRSHLLSITHQLLNSLASPKELNWQRANDEDLTTFAA